MADDTRRRVALELYSAMGGWHQPTDVAEATSDEAHRLADTVMPIVEELRRCLQLAHTHALQGGYGSEDRIDRDRVRVALGGEHIVSSTRCVQISVRCPECGSDDPSSTRTCGVSCGGVGPCVMPAGHFDIDDPRTGPHLTEREAHGYNRECVHGWHSAAAYFAGGGH